MEVRREEVGIAATQALVQQTRDDLRMAEDEASRVNTLKTDLARCVLAASAKSSPSPTRPPADVLPLRTCVQLFCILIVARSSP